MSDAPRTQKEPQFDYSLSSFDLFLVMVGLGLAVFFACAGIALVEWAS